MVSAFGLVLVLAALAGCNGAPLPLGLEIDGGVVDGAPAPADGAQAASCAVDLDVPIRVQGGASCSVARIGGALTLRARVLAGGAVLDLEVDAVANATATLPGPGLAGWYSVSSGLYCGEVRGTVRELDESGGDRFMLRLACGSGAPLQPASAASTSTSPNADT
ncbi:MAG: hypothetical protein ACHP9U_07175, partial [Steroidobacterales bacterium]